MSSYNSKRGTQLDMGSLRGPDLAKTVKQSTENLPDLPPSGRTNVRALQVSRRDDEDRVVGRPKSARMKVQEDVQEQDAQENVQEQNIQEPKARKRQLSQLLTTVEEQPLQPLSVLSKRGGSLNSPTATSKLQTKRYDVKDASPWESYRAVFQLKLDRFVTVAAKRGDSHKCVLSKRFDEPSSREELYMLNNIRHENIVNVLEIFRFEKSIFVILEFMIISLEEIVESPAYPDEDELAAIMGQIINGLAYLASKKLQHGSLSCSNVLVNADGEVKIASQESCRDMGSNDSGIADVRALGIIAVWLMQKYSDGDYHVADLVRWPKGSAGSDFVLTTSSANSVEALMKVK